MYLHFAFLVVYCTLKTITEKFQLVVIGFQVLEPQHRNKKVKQRTGPGGWTDPVLPAKWWRLHLWKKKETSSTVKVPALGKAPFQKHLLIAFLGSSLVGTTMIVAAVVTTMVTQTASTTETSTTTTRATTIKATTTKATTTRAATTREVSAVVAASATTV